MISVTSTPVELIDDDTATTYYNDLDKLEGEERESRAEALRLWADQKDVDQKRDQFDTLNKIYSDFDGYVDEAGLKDFDEDSRYRTANRQFIASQFDQTPEEQQEIYSSFRDKWTETVVGKKGMSEKETFGLIKQGIDARNEVSEAANQIPGDIALSLFDSIGGGNPVDVPKLVETWKTKNAESIKKLPPGWEAPLLESAQAFHTETEGMLRDYAEPLKKVYDHLSVVTGRDTKRAEETNPKNQEELDSMVDTLASMPKPVRERAYASVVLGAQKAGQDPKTFMEQWGESWSRTLNMVRTGALTAQEMAAESDLRMLEDKASPPDYYISKSTGEKIPLANRAFYDEADLRKVAPEEIAAEADQARQKVKRFEVVRELQNLADNQFDPIEKINKGGFLGFMEAMAYGSPQGLAYTATALVPIVGPYAAGAAIYSDEYNQLRQQGMSVDQAVQVGSVSAAVQAGLERTGAKAIFGKLPVFEKLMRKIANPARVGKAGSAGVRFLAAAAGEQLVEGAQDLTTPLVQDISEALGADVPDVKWQPILEQWGGSRLDVLAASLPTILLGTGVATFADNKRFALFEERQDKYRMMGMDDATIKEIEDGKNLAEVQQNFQSAFSKLTPENVKAGVAYMEGKIASAQDQQQDPNTHTLTRETLADGSKKFVIRDSKGEVRYSTADEQSAQIALRELLRTQITGTTRGIFESLSFFNQMNEAAGRGEDVQKFILENTPRNLLDEYEANPTEQNLDNLFKTVRSQGQDINEPAELANFPVLASNQGALVEGVFRSIIQIQDGATGDKVIRDFSQDNLKRAISEGRITMDWVRENLNQVIPLIESERITGPTLRTETDTDVIESFSDVAVAYMTGRIREEQIPAGFRGFLRRMAIIVKDIFRRSYNLKRAIAEGKVDSNFESFLADSVGLNQQARVDTARERVSNEVLTDTSAANYSIGSDMVVENGRAYSPRVRDLLQRRAAGEDIPRSVIDQAISDNFPAQLVEFPKSESELPSRATIDDSINEGQRRDQIDKSSIQPGDAVTIRQDVPAMTRKGVGVVTIKGKSGNSYDAAARISDPQFILNEKKSLEIGMGGAKGPHIAIRGKWVSDQSMPSDLSEWTQVGFNPDRHSFYYDRATMKQVVGGSEAYQIGNTVFVKDARFGDGQISDISYSIGKKNSLRVKMTRTAITDAALNQASWRDWYEQHQSTLDDLFGNHAQLFQDILSVTSQAASVKANVGLALKAFGQFHRGEDFNGFLPAVIGNLNRLRENTQVSGQKISAYKNSNDGKVDEAVIDRHIARLIFGVDSPSKNQFAKAQRILAEIANDIGWTPRQVQAALWAHSIYKSGKTPESYGDYLKKLESKGTIEQRIGDLGRRGPSGDADGGRRGRFAPESTADGAGLSNYSIQSIEHFKNDKRFDKLVADGRVVIGRDIEDFKGMHILLHSPDNAFSGTIRLTDGEEIQGKGGVYYPALYANKNYFWASTEGKVMQSANHLNEIGQKNGGKILMALVSAPVEKLFSSTSMATGVVKFLNSLTSDTKAGLSKEDLNSMLVAASKVEFVKEGAKVKKFSLTLAESDGLKKNLSKVGALLDPTKSIFQVRKMFSESLADQLSKHLKTNPEGSSYVAEILADAENKHSKAPIKKGNLSKASILQGLGNLFTEPFLRDFQNHGNGKIYAVLEVDGELDGVASKAHDSYPFTLVPRNKKSKVKLHILNQAVDWQDVVGRESGEYSTPAERLFLMPTGGMSVKTLKVLGVRDGSKANPLNYSISSQSEIDRVERALGGMNRGPDARLAVYERAKAKLLGLMQSNQASLDDLRKGTVSFRRTQVLQALGELDAILSIFPPDLRGRVGGYTRLASIAPHDVFRDGEKVSEVSGMNGAIISAWMREGQNIGQAGQQTELPPGYTAKENLGTARADRAISDFFKKRIEMIDRELEKTLRREYDEAFRKLLDRTKPKKAAPGEKPKGIGGDIQDLFAVVRDSVDMSATDVLAHIAGLDAKIASGELTAEQEARAQVEAALVSLTGDWKNADSDRRRTALTEATRIWSGAYAAHAQKVIRQREEREIARAEAIVATGKIGDMAGRTSKAISDSGLGGTWKNYILNLLNFDQVVSVLFGENSDFSNTIIDKQRLAENAKEDGSQAKMQALEDFFSGLAGDNLLAGERVRYALTQPSMTVNDIQMSQLEGLSAVMMWAQEDGRRHMEGERDENGRASGKWSYDQAFVDEITTNLSAEALALRDWLGQQYSAEYANINAVYSDLNGVNLPQIQNYSPVTVQPVNAPAGQVLDPVSGSAMSGASTSPGALRTRGTSIAEPRFQDALQTYISHTLQMEHWKAFAPMLAEVNGILRNRDVQNSVQEKGGIEARKMLNSWLDYFGQGGTRDAGAHLALNQGLNNFLGRAQQVALIGRISTLLIQSTQLGAALAEVPLGPYLKRMGKLLSGQLSWDAALNSDYIQRRIKQMPPVVQMAMQGLKGAKPTAIQQAGKRLGMLLSGADGLFTAGTYAIVYDWHLSKAKELGLAGQQAEDYARNTAERATDRIAQPTRAGARSLYENTSTNPLARAGWAFASEARKNFALVAYSFAERDTATKLRTLAYVVALNAIGSQILRSIWRDTQDDDDEELFDDKYWNPKRFLMAAATEPLYGIPVFGSMLEEAVYKSAGEYNPQTSLFSVASAVGPIKRLPDHLSGDTEMRDVFSDIDKIISSLGVMHPNIAATASMTHLAKDLFGLADSAVDAATED